MPGLLDGFEQQYPGLIGKLAQTWPVRTAQGLLSGLMLPGDGYQGKFAVQPEKPGWITEGDIANQDAVDRELIRRSNDLAGAVTLGAGAMPAEANSLRSGMSFFDKVAEKYPGVKIDGSVDRSGYATLSRVEVPKELRNQGLGTKVMNDLLAEADASGVSMALTPSSDFGGSKARLVEFYKRFGFVPNSGRNKDFSTREAMIRPKPE